MAIRRSTSQKDQKTLGNMVAEAERTGVYSIIRVESPRYMLMVTRRNKIDKRDCRVEYVVTLGTPNFDARRKIVQRRSLGTLKYPFEFTRTHSYD